MPGIRNGPAGNAERSLCPDVEAAGSNDDPQAVMTGKNGRWEIFADARGIDAKYAQVRRQAEEELAGTEAGPRGGPGVSPDDTRMKNPDGEFQRPSARTGKPARHDGAGPNGPGNSKRGGTIDPQGQQGAAGVGRK